MSMVRNNLVDLIRQVRLQEFGQHLKVRATKLGSILCKKFGAPIDCSARNWEGPPGTNNQQHGPMDCSVRKFLESTIDLRF